MQWYKNDFLSSRAGEKEILGGFLGPRPSSSGSGHTSPPRSALGMVLAERLLYSNASAVSAFGAALRQQLPCRCSTGSGSGSGGGGGMAAMSSGQDNNDQHWHDAWQQGVDPGKLWDAGRCPPALSHLLDSGLLGVAGKRVLVPGCGRGYDVFAFARAGAAAAVGLDLCERAVAAAAEQRGAELAGDPAAAARCQLVAGDFFEHRPPWEEPDEGGGGGGSGGGGGGSGGSDSPNGYDVGWDYTFCCALPPARRPAWAAAWARLLEPGGELAAIVFPTAPPFGRPPWPVSPELYRELLLPAGFEEVSLEPLPVHLSHRARAGREWLGRWRRLPAGTDSKAALEEPAATCRL